jgi:glycerate kinase
MDPGALGLLSQGVDALVPTAIGAGSVADALSHAERNFALAADRTFSLLALGRGMGECS